MIREAFKLIMYLAASFHFIPDIPKVLPQLNPNQPHLWNENIEFSTKLFAVVIV